MQLIFFHKPDWRGKFEETKNPTRITNRCLYVTAYLLLMGEKDIRSEI